jgi:hypothetical protein
MNWTTVPGVGDDAAFACCTMLASARTNEIDVLWEVVGMLVPIDVVWFKYPVAVHPARCCCTVYISVWYVAECRMVIVTIFSIFMLLLPPLLVVMLCLLQQLLRETRHMHATRGLYEQLAAMQQQPHDDDR